MENRKIKHSYGGMVKDVTSSQFQPNFYYEGKNIRINSTDSQSTNSITNEKGNSLILTIPVPTINYDTKVITYGSKTLNFTTDEIDYLTQSEDQIIIGHSNSREDIILFTTDNNGFDCIWKVNYETYDITLLYLRNLKFSINNPIQTINNFENQYIDKVYWVDGFNQMRFINIKHSVLNQDLEELIDVSQNVIDMVGKTILTQPIITDVTTGGTHTSGMIQYAYNLYRINSSQTKISPLSELIPLDRDSFGGGALNELVGAVPIISITNIDTSYTNIKVYAIKYTSFNEIPSISLIDDRSIPSNGNIEIFDDGIIINTLSLEEFIFLGSDIIIPKHINTKFNRLFFANYKEINFDVDLDTRAYSYNSSNIATVYSNLRLNSGVPDGDPTLTFNISTDGDYDNIILNKHDSVNLNYDVFKYQKDGITFGGEGKYLKYELTQTSLFNKDNRYFKDDEIYRIGIEFFNAYGQISQPKWIADIKSRDGNLSGNYNTLKVTLKPDFFTWLSTTIFDSEYDVPTGYKVIVAERTAQDKTIVANGLLSSMMVDLKTTDNGATPTVPIVNGLPKLPNILIRNCNNTTLNGNTRPLRRAEHLRLMNEQADDPDTEVQLSNVGDSDVVAGRLYQFNSMLQLYSPEILFGDSVAISDNLKLRIKGSLKNTDNNSWLRRYITPDQGVDIEGKAIGGISPQYSTSKIDILDNVDRVLARGIISHPSDSEAERVVHSMFSREYGDVDPMLPPTGSYLKSPISTVLDIYGKPEVTEKGQSGTNYNNDPNYRYINSLESVLTDGDNNFAEDGKFNRKIVSIKSYGNRCITLVTGSNDPLVIHSARPLLETICTDAGLTGDNNGLIGELVKNDAEIYLGNIYGGNSYEDKKRSNYIEVGDFTELDSLNPSLTINSPGDTFVNGFEFTRIVRTDVDSVEEGVYVLEELVEFLTETTVNLSNRNDLSLLPWDSRFQPLDSEYHKYNKVYSQLSTLTARRGLNYNIKKINSLDTNIITTKLKSAGEIIDSWTDVLPNEVLTLDGKHGTVNSLVSFNDELYCIQDKAFAFLSISPRVQITGGDGLQVQLGTGSVLDRYQYISTDSGTLNKWSVVATSQGVYYFDLLNKSFMVFKNQINGLSDTKSMHSYFINNIELENLKIDNPLIKQGISAGFDHINNDVFMTFLNSEQSFTLSFNESRNQFISFYDYLPSMYISKGQYFITTNLNLKSIYRQYEGNYNNFYGINYPSYVILNINPEANLDTVFDNIMYKSEVYLNDIDQPDKTLTKVRLYSEYQDSGLIPLTLGRNSNLRRKFRDWNAILPRNQGSRERIRNPWVKLVLQFDNTSNYKLILHDIIVSYSI
jgi:hypothetical protein